MRCARLAGNAGPKKSPSGHHRTTLLRYVFVNNARIDNRKNLLSSNTSFTCPDNTVNFGPLTAEMGSGVWGTPANFYGFRVLAALLYATGRQPNLAALNRVCHLYSAGRPSRWALAHILVLFVFSGHLLVQFYTAFVSCRRIRGSVVYVSFCFLSHKFDLI